MNKLVSIVIPVYNVQDYLDRCLESLVNQSYKELQIILVDDGATDCSGEMCDAWAQKDARIKVVHKKNAGAGMARNTGIEYADGTYICFFDSDDYIDQYTVEHAVMLAEKENAQIVIFGKSSVDHNGNVVRKAIPESKKVCYSGREVMEELVPSILQPNMKEPATRNLVFNAWSCLFLAEIIQKNNWRFVSERQMMSEDIYSPLELYQYVDRVAVLQEALYFYCENNASLTHSYHPNRYEQNKFFYEACMRLCEKNQYPDIVRKSCRSPFLGNAIAAMKQEAKHATGIKNALARIRGIVCDDLLQEIVHSKKGDPMSLQIKVLFWAIRKKYCLICYWLLALCS